MRGEMYFNDFSTRLQCNKMWMKGRSLKKFGMHGVWMSWPFSWPSKLLLKTMNYYLQQKIASSKKPPKTRGIFWSLEQLATGPKKRCYRKRTYRKHSIFKSSDVRYKTRMVCLTCHWASGRSSRPPAEPWPRRQTATAAATPHHLHNGQVRSNKSTLGRRTSQVLSFSRQIRILSYSKSTS